MVARPATRPLHPGPLLNFAYAAHRSGNQAVKRYAVQTLADQFGIKVTFPKPTRREAAKHAS